MKDLLILLAHLIDYDRQTLGTRRCEGRCRWQPAHEAATPGHQSFSVTSAQSFGAWSIPVLLLVAVSWSTPDSAGGGDYSAIDTF
jgi:hypothetical protein